MGSFFFPPAMHSAGVKDQDAVLLTQNAKCVLLLELSHPLIVNQILRCSSSPSPQPVPASAQDYNVCSTLHSLIIFSARCLSSHSCVILRKSRSRPCYLGAPLRVCWVCFGCWLHFQFEQGLKYRQPAGLWQAGKSAEM